MAKQADKNTVNDVLSNSVAAANKKAAPIKLTHEEEMQAAIDKEMAASIAKERQAAFDALTPEQQQIINAQMQGLPAQDSGLALQMRQYEEQIAAQQASEAQQLAQMQAAQTASQSNALMANLQQQLQEVARMKEQLSQLISNTTMAVRPDSVVQTENNPLFKKDSLISGHEYRGTFRELCVIPQFTASYSHGPLVYRLEKNVRTDVHAGLASKLAKIQEVMIAES